jgi:beta-glucosidase
VACQTDSRVESAAYRDPSLPVERRVDDLLGRMTLREKAGQMTQSSVAKLTRTSDIATFGLGSVLSGGDDAPTPNTPVAWADQFDRLQRIALSTRLSIPLLYGIDSVHGFSHAIGTTIFPHNIALGATRDAALVREIGRITALEMAGTGIRWDFAPCLAVVQNERWGRTYESFGEDPGLVSSMTAMIEGMQGDDLRQPSSIIATAKHFVGDGGTLGGRDQGDTLLDEADLRSVHMEPYRAAIARGARAVMVSYSSWNGEKMHGSRRMITDTLKGELGFKGIVISDWDGVAQLPGGYADQVREAINAGIDIVMTPDGYSRFSSALESAVAEGAIPMERIDDAVRRILAVKFRMGLFEQPWAAREYLAETGSAENRAVARRAVRESIVVLKNEAGILPLPRTIKRLLVTGRNADNLGNQLGGWSLTWQGLTGAVTSGTTILEGIRGAVSRDTRIVFDPEAAGSLRDFDAAIAIVGETPYAEYHGDRPGSLGLDASDAIVMDRLRRSGIPTVAVIVSGRPLIITDLLPHWKALVEAWLPGTEGAGVADVLFGRAHPTGKLPLSWPRSDDQVPASGAADSRATAGARGAGAPLFPYGFGLSY